MSEYTEVKVGQVWEDCDKGLGAGRSSNDAGTTG